MAPAADAGKSAPNYLLRLGLQIPNFSYGAPISALYPAVVAQAQEAESGFEFGTFTDRFERLEEALQIITPMLRGERSTFEGRWYRTESVVNNPRFRDDMSILIGGSGERKTFALAARYADHLNIIAPFNRLPRKIEALKRRCQEHDRDPGTLETSALITVVVTDAAGASDAFTPNSHVAVGNLNDIAEQIKRCVIDVGISGVVVNFRHTAIPRP